MTADEIDTDEFTQSMASLAEGFRQLNPKPRIVPVRKVNDDLLPSCFVADRFYPARFPT
jgi:hypothetical protein